MAAAESHLFNVFAHPEQVFVRGEGVWLFDDKGERYLDFIAGIAVNGLGHAHPKLVSALTEQAQKLWHISNMYKIEGQEKLAAKYCEKTFADVVFFTNSGTEAIECALKMARRYHAVGGHPEKVDIIGFSGSFHGRSYAAINASGNASYLDGFGPHLPGYVHCEFGDWEKLNALVGPATAAILIEPVQGEGGVQVVPDEALRLMRKLCDEHGAVLIFDEVQCGAGRTGKLFAHEWSGVAPDVMTIAKAVGGGFPLGACLSTREAARGMTRGVHGTTYGGNPLAMAVGNAAWDILAEDKFLEHVRDMSNHLGQALEGLKDRHPKTVVETRGRGLLRGLKLTVDPKTVQAAARNRKLLVGVAGDNVLRLAPPLILEPEHVSMAAELIDAALTDVENAA
ncbi:MAG TPA: aspartate aminotransferase family protein [Caulobacterales bacterium]|nr:aspartate aminotransferase family protein [Caulobacterales bacterium]